MSGHKRTTITLSPEEYRKLHEAEMRLRFMNEAVPEIVNQTRKEITEKLKIDMADMHFRQEALLQSLDQVNSEISLIEQNTSQSLLDQEIAIHHGVSEMIEDYHVNTETALATIESQVQSQLDNLLDHHNEDWEWMLSEWQQHNSGQRQKMQLATEWLKASSVFSQFIQDNYDHNRFTPDAVRQFEARLVQAQNNISQNLPEAAIAAAQEAYYNFSELRLTLEKRQSEYQLLLNRVSLGSQKLHSVLDSNQLVPAIDLDGSPLPYNITVNYWTNGELDQLVQEFDQVVADFVESEHHGTTSDLHHLIDDYFPYVQDKIGDLVFDARMNVLNAQLRMNIAEIVVDALSGQGYALDSSYFQAGDERDAYQANLINYEGSQVVVKVDPVESQAAVNELHLFASDAQEKTSHELKQRALEIRRALQSTGLEVGTITATRQVPAGVFSPEETNTQDPKSERQTRQTRKLTKRNVKD